jgi:hypothetical protein
VQRASKRSHFYCRSWKANKGVTEWLSALREAIRVCTGRTLSVDHSDAAQNWSWWYLAKSFFLSAVGCTVAFSVIPLMIYQRLPNRWSELLPGPILAAVMMALFLVVRWWQRQSAAIAECDDRLGASRPEQAQTESEGNQRRFMAAAVWQIHGLDYRSKTTLFGLPLVHVATGMDPATGRKRVAKGIMAIGDIAQGGIAFGGIAVGGIAVGGLAMGVFAFGGRAERGGSRR